MADYKTCKTCREVLPVDEFHRTGRFTMDGTPTRKPTCKACLSIYRRHYEETRYRNKPSQPFGFKAGSIEEKFFMRVKPC